MAPWRRDTLPELNDEPKVHGLDVLVPKLSSVDRKGGLKIVLFDGRVDSPTVGAMNEFRVSERNPGLLVIPPNLYHGWKNMGDHEAIIINMPSSRYEYDHPDALDLPYESEDAGEIVPFRW